MTNRSLPKHSEKLKVAVDVDGVLAETMEAWCKSYNQIHGTSLSLRDINSWSSWIKLGISKNEFYRLLDGTWDDWIEIPPTEPNLAEKVKKAEKHAVLDIVTGRSENTVLAVKKWLRHEKIEFNQFIRVRGWRYKILLDYDVYIDDAPELMPLISENPNLHGILYQRPWNMDVPDLPRIIRAESWTEIPDVLDTIQTGRVKGPRATGTAKEKPVSCRIV